MITAAEFRNSSLASLLVGYDWPSGAHFADLTLASADGSLLTYRISELSAWSAFEDFQAQHIEQCTLLHDQSGVYLALDPYLEGQRSPQDNLWFAGISVELVPGSNIVQAETASFQQRHGIESLPCLCLHYAVRLNSGVRPCFPHCCCRVPGNL